MLYVFAPYNECVLRFPGWASSEATQPSIQWLLWILSRK